ncbi:hypothetical protein SAMN05428949_0218 [Chitinophaga sp. YR627]|nr:hypothetical protein SAMN05428949_0218 [Chitinophaga sp. YR627]
MPDTNDESCWYRAFIFMLTGLLLSLQANILSIRETNERSFVLVIDLCGLAPDINMPVLCIFIDLFQLRICKCDIL